MNWTASLLRNQLKKEREAHAAQLNFLTSTSLDAQNLKKDLLKEQEALKILANHRKEQINSLQEQLQQEKQALIALAKKKIANKKEWLTLFSLPPLYSLYIVPPCVPYNVRELREEVEGGEEQLENKNKDMNQAKDTKIAELEAKLKEIEAKLQAANENLTKAKNQAESKEKVNEKQVKEAKEKDKAPEPSQPQAPSQPTNTITLAERLFELYPTNPPPTLYYIYIYIY